MTETCLNYFTEIEEHFRRVRGTPLFRLSSKDWALIDEWKRGGIPLEAVLRGIDTTFEKWRRRPAQSRTQIVNSLGYCAQAVIAEAQRMAGAAPATFRDISPSFSLDDIRSFVTCNAAALRKARCEDLAVSLESLDLDVLYSDLDLLEQKLTTIEEKMVVQLRVTASEEALTEARHALDFDLKPYRGRMTADQLAMLETQFLERKLLESAALPRLSLYYM